MKTRFPRSPGWALLILCLCLGLSGCSSPGKEAEPTAAPTATAGNTVRGTYSAMKKAWLLDSSVYSALNGRCTASFMWTVPRDVLSQAALDLTGAAGTAEGDMVRYTVSVTSNSSYTATGMDPGVLDAVSAAGDGDTEEDPSGDGEMVTELMGDFAMEGGGEYERGAVWLLSPDWLRGEAEITMSLNGEESGEEHFAFLVRDDVLYFYDAAENATLFDDEGADVSEPTWLITCGQVGQDSARIAEYTGTSGALPGPESLALLPTEAEGRGVTLLVFENGKGTVSRDGKAVQEFAAP